MAHKGCLQCLHVNMTGVKNAVNAWMKEICAGGGGRGGGGGGGVLER